MATDVAQTVHPERVTRLLIDWGNGEQAALDEMLPLVYEDLRRLAAFYMGSRPAATQGRIPTFPLEQPVPIG